MRRILNEARNKSRKEDASLHKGERTYHSTSVDSIDAPLGSDEDGSRAYELEAEDSSDDKIGELRDRISSYLYKAEDAELLSGSELNLLKSISQFGSEVMDNDKINYELLGTRIGKSASNVGTMMSNIVKKMKQGREKGIV